MASSLSLSGDIVFITKDDLEGYQSPSHDCPKQLVLVPKLTRAKPMIARLSCLFASLKVSGGFRAVSSRQLTETQAF